MSSCQPEKSVDQKTLNIKNSLNILSQIHKTESSDDATCWSTISKTESYLLSRRIDTSARILKVEALKILFSKFLHKFEGDLEEIPLINQTMDNSKLKTLSRSSENFRIILDGLYENLLELSSDNYLLAFNKINEINYRILSLANDYSIKNSKKIIDVDSIKYAYKSIINEFALTDTKKPIGVIDQKKIGELNRLLVKNKIDSLKRWNKLNGPINNERIRESLNHLIDKPFTRLGFNFFFQRLVKITGHILKGNNNIGTDINMPLTLFLHPDIDIVKSENIGIISPKTTYNILNKLFPREELSNGDVVYYVAENFIHNITGEKPNVIRVVLKEEDLDAVRDTVLPWKIIDDSLLRYGSSSHSPHSFEILSERLTEISLAMIRLMNDFGPKGKKITENSLKNVFEKHLYFVKGKSSNIAREFNGKSEVLKRYGNLFLDLTEKSGISRKICKKKNTKVEVYQYSHTQEYLGSGLAIGDFNNDGNLDLFYPGEGCNRLYKGNGDLTFTDVTQKWNVDGLDLIDSKQALFVDIDNDHLLDIFILDSKGDSKIFRQDNNKFIDITLSSGIKTKKSAHTATFLDFNNDGLLDIYIGHYGIGFSSLDGNNGVENQLYKNLGDGKFKDVSDASGIATPRWTMAVTSFDVNLDGYADIFSGNANGVDELFINQKDGTFKEMGAKYSLFSRGDTMNASVTDFNNDGRWDIFITVIDMFSRNLRFVFPKGNSIKTLDDQILNSTLYLSGNKMYLSTKEGFIPTHEVFEPGRMGLGWSANFFDYENDGDQDLYVANGYVDNVITGAQKNLFYMNENNRYYRLSGYVEEELKKKQKDDVISFKGNSRSVIHADLNNDGLLDLIVGNFNNGLKVFKNNAKQKNNWIKIKLKGRKSNSYGVGSVIKIKTEDGKRIQRLVSAGSNYLSQDDLTVTFGIGKNKSVSEIEVYWSGGNKESYKGKYKNNNTYLIEQGSGPYYLSKK